MTPARPVVCICELNGVIGLLLRKDYDEASKLHWENVVRGEAWWDPGRSDGCMGDPLPIPDGLVFVFKSFSQEHRAFDGDLFLERAEFGLPVEGHWSKLPNSKKEFERAQIHFFGKVIIPDPK